MSVKIKRTLLYALLIVFAAVFLAPIFIVLMNSFKDRLYITSEPFALPNAETFAGAANYTSGLDKTGFFSAFAYSLFITVGSPTGKMASSLMNSLPTFSSDASGKVIK